jgi:hexosaminidase
MNSIYPGALALAYVALSLLVSCTTKPATDLSKESLIPKPISVQPTGGAFAITLNTSIYFTGPAEVRQVGQFLQQQLTPSTGFTIKLESSPAAPEEGIYLTLAPDPDLGEEGYILEITDDLLTVKANKAAGLFHGVQSIRQLLPPAIELGSKQAGPWTIPTGTIKDYPAYPWRGSMLDVARHFFTVQDVKRYIDLISYYKMNVLHLHLSDDQGWRIEIKSWPNLALHGGSTEVGGGKGGFYTQEQYADIVAYAKTHYITIVPEIDLPGHINSALAAYGELNGGTTVPEEGRVPIVSQPTSPLGTKARPTELYTGIKVGWSTLRIEKEQTFRFVNDVIRELSDMTPGPYFHIGGDEAHVTKKKDYVAFINRFREIVHANGKRMIGWEEIAQADIDSTAIAQHWASAKFAALAAEKQAKLIMSPAKKAYLDMSYDSSTKLGLHWAAYIEVDSAYLWSPETQLPGVGKENILGIEAPLWTETITNIDEIEFMAFPRIPGYAEIGWTPAAARNWDEYKVRLGRHGPRLSAMKVDFYRSKLVPWQSNGDQ